MNVVATWLCRCYRKDVKNGGQGLSKDVSRHLVLKDTKKDFIRKAFLQAGRMLISSN